MDNRLLRTVPAGKGWQVKTTKTGEVRVVMPDDYTPTVGLGQGIVQDSPYIVPRESSWDTAGKTLNWLDTLTEPARWAAGAVTGRASGWDPSSLRDAYDKYAGAGTKAGVELLSPGLGELGGLLAGVSRISKLAGDIPKSIETYSPHLAATLRGNKPQAPGDVLYHVTTDLPAVQESGKLMGFNAEVRNPQGGLGSGLEVDRGVSFTPKRQDALLTAREMLRTGEAARGEMSPERLLQYVDEDAKLYGMPTSVQDGLRKAVEKDILPGLRRALKSLDRQMRDVPKYAKLWAKEYPAEQRVEKERYWLDRLPQEYQNQKGEAMLDAYKTSYLYRRSRLAGIIDPIIFGGAKRHSTNTPENVAILGVPTSKIPDWHPVDNPKGDPWNMETVGETKVYGEVPVQGSYVVKYDPDAQRWGVVRPEGVVGGGQDVGVGADGDDANSFWDYLGGRLGNIGRGIDQGNWGWAAGQSAMLPFELIPKTLGWAAGGPVMGTAANVRNALFGQESEGTNYDDVPLLSGQIEGGDVLDWKKAQERWERVNPLARMGIETAATLWAPTKVLQPLDKALQARAARKALEAKGADVMQLGRIATTGPETLAERIAGSSIPTLATVGARVAGPAAVGVAVATGNAPEGQEYSVPERIFSGVGTAAVATGVGWGVLKMGQKALERSLASRPKQFPTEIIDRDPAYNDLRTSLGKVNEAMQVEEGFIGGAIPIPMYPTVVGHSANATWNLDWQASKWLDSSAMLKRWKPRVEAVYAQGLRGAGKDVSKLSIDEDALSQYRLMSGVGRQVEALQQPMVASFNANLKNRAEKNVLYETWLFHREALERAKRGHTTGHITKEAQATTLLDQLESQLTTRYGADIIPRFEKLAGDITSKFDGQLERMVKAQILTPEEVVLIKDSHDIYTFMKDVEFFKPRLEGEIGWLGDQSKFGPTFLARTKGIEREHTSSKLVATDIVDTMNNFAFREALLQKNRLGLSLVKWREIDPDGFGRFMRPVAPDAAVERGWSRIPVFQVMPLSANLRMESQLAKIRLATEGIDVGSPSGRAAAAAAHNLDPKDPELIDKLLKAKLSPDELRLFTPINPKYRDALVVKHGISRTDATGRKLTADDLDTELKKVVGMDDVVEQVEKQVYAVPDRFHNALMGMTNESADVTTRIMSRFGDFFKKGVTMFSIPFIFRNPQRDVETALVNMGMNSITVNSYFAALLDGLDTVTKGSLYKVLTKYKGSPLGGFDPWGRIGVAMKSMRTPEGKSWSQEMFESRGGLGTFAEQLRPSGSSALKDIGIEGSFPIVNPFEALRQGAEVMELATRVGVYRTARLGGTATAEEAALMAREATVDFSRGGNSLRLLNSWIPLLNARVQGQYRTVEAMQEDPYGFFLRSTVMVTLPTLFTYQHNREHFSDLYDMIPPEVKDRYYTIIFGSYNDRNGGVRPLYFTIPKDAWHQVLATPIEHLMDQLYHVRNHEDTLPPEQRTERDAVKTALAMISALSPVSVNLNEMSDLADPLKWGQALMQAVPPVGMAAQLIANQDWQRGKVPIVDPYDDRLSGEDWPDMVSGPTVKLISDALKVTPLWKPAPAEVAFMFKSLGGTAAQTFLGAGDIAVERLGLTPPRTIDPSKLQLPEDLSPEAYERIAKQMDARDYRPWESKYMPWWFGASGGQQTQVAKVRQLGEKDQRKYWDTQNGNALVREMIYDTDKGYIGSLRTIEKKLQNTIKHEEAVSDLFNLGEMRRGAFLTAKKKYKDMIVDPTERREFIDSLPGVAMKSEWRQTPTKGLTEQQLQSAIDRWENPPSLKGNKQLMSNPQIFQGGQNSEIQKMAREFKIEPNDLRDQLQAAKLDRKVPLLTVPAIWIEEAVTNYRFPPEWNPKEDPPEKLPLARRAAINRLAAQWKQDPQQLWDRIVMRLTQPEEQSPMMVSWERALALASDSRDPTRFPQFADVQGNPVGSPEQWYSWTKAIEEAKERWGTDRRKWRLGYRQFDDWVRYADVKRLAYVQNHPDYDEYQRWFGLGKGMTGGQWDAYMLGEVPRYKGVADAETANRMDATIALYSALPISSPMKRQLAPLVKRYRKLANPGWRKYILAMDEQYGYESGETAEIAALYETAMGGS